MLGNVINQGLGIIAGQQKGFSWSSVAASAVGGAVGSFVGGKLDAKFASTALSPNRTNDIIKGVASGIAGNVASQLTQIAIDGRGRLNWTSVAVSGIYGVGSGLETNRRLEAERAAMGSTTAVRDSMLELRPDGKSPWGDSVIVADASGKVPIGMQLDKINVTQTELESKASKASRAFLQLNPNATDAELSAIMMLKWQG